MNHKLVQGFSGLIVTALLINVVSCTSSGRKEDIPRTSKSLNPLLGIIYDQPVEITETITSPQNSGGIDLNIKLKWSPEKVVLSLSYDSEYIFLGPDRHADSSYAKEGRELVHYLKTPFYKTYISYSRFSDQGENHFYYRVDTLNRQVWEFQHPSDTSSYSFDYFSREGFLMHRFVKLTPTESYHLYYKNDNHGNPLEERMVMLRQKGPPLDFIQEKFEYQYDVQGNWIVKNQYHFLAGDPVNSKHVQHKRKIVYAESLR